MESVTQLFTDKNVDEMNELESKTRREIELKKEELRQMVGERYRDLIEAADTIAEMKRCSANVGDSIKDLKLFCSAKTVKTKRESRAKQKQSAKDHKRYMEISAEAKVLMELPEKIWSQVESGNMISASFLYLQSLQVVKNLSLGASYSPILLWFPMLGQQAQAVANLGSAILKQCHSRLTDHLVDPSKTAEALCSIVLLNKQSAFDIFKTMLQSRKQVIADILSSESAYQSIGAKARICESTSVLVQTVMNISKLFCQDSNGLVAELLESCANQSSHDVINRFMGNHEATKLWSKHLPAETTKNLADLKSVELVVSQELLQKECGLWLADIKEIMVKGIRDLLKFTTNAKDLAIIRNSLFEIVNIDTPTCQDKGDDKAEWMFTDGEASQETVKKWSLSCSSIFGREVMIWEEILNDLFVDKVSQLVTETFITLLTESKQILSACSTSEKYLNVCSYVWQEHEDDILPSMAWNHWQSRKTHDLQKQGGLSLKALTITPRVHQLCSEINSVIVSLLDDLECYVPGIKKSNLEKRKSVFSLTKDEPLETNVEGTAIRTQLRSTCLQFLHNLLEYISTLKEQFSSENAKATPENLTKVLELSLVCRNFFEICTSFYHCCTISEDGVKQVSARSQYRDMIMSKSKMDSASTDSEWKTIVVAMNKQCRELMCIWCDNILSNVFKDFKNQLLSSVENGFLLKTITSWDVIAVEEESETGSTVTSHIKIPSSTTSFTQDLLYTLCSRITGVGGFSTCRFTLRDVAQKCLKLILGAFSELRHTLSTADTSLHGQSRTHGEAMVPSQTWALQCLFDLRYIHMLLYQTPMTEAQDKDYDSEDDDDDNARMDEGSSTYTFTELVDWLESYVDPFDLDVFSPHITRNLQRHIQRTSIMLGILAAPDRVGTAGPQKLGIVKDSHNVLPMTADCGRFSYLPVSGRSTRSHKRLTAVSRQLPLASALRELTRSVDEDEDKNSQQKKLSSSLYSKLGALSSSWLSMSSSYTDE
uniref:Conserved oligomeric Golgi complex subunit 1 n=1 Tax=Phallusia mammillata TaxID=59560 RepID=A0A6F9D9W6_9ASCI|nr:conserved oligomeric Golgi complex subunit 1-like [Phallusia mammillata]